MQHPLKECANWIFLGIWMIILGSFLTFWYDYNYAPYNDYLMVPVRLICGFALVAGIIFIAIGIGYKQSAFYSGEYYVKRYHYKKL